MQAEYSETITAAAQIPNKMRSSPISSTINIDETIIKPML